MMDNTPSSLGDGYGNYEINSAVPDAVNTTTVELHEILSAVRVDWRQVEQRLESHPEEARRQQRRRRHNEEVISALQHVLGRSHSNNPIPMSVVHKLLDIDPSAVWLGIESHTSPLHLACRYNPTVPLLQTLVEARPLVPDYDDSAFLNLWYYYVKLLGGVPSELADFLCCEGGREALRIYCQLSIVMNGPRLRNLDDDGRILHAVASLVLDPVLLHQSISTFPNQVRKPDPTTGQLPMHCFLSKPIDQRPMSIRAAGYCGSFVFDLMPLFDILHAAYPESLSVPDQEGRLPLHCAIESRGWDTDFLDHIVQAYPPALYHSGGAYRLLPFQIAAMSSSPAASSLTSTFLLLRKDPQVLLIQSTSSRSSSSFCGPKVNKEYKQQSPEPWETEGPLTAHVMELIDSVSDTQNSTLWGTLTELLKLRRQRPSFLLAHHLAGMKLCPACALQVFWQYDPETFTKLDEHGQLPIHHVVAVGKQEQRWLQAQGFLDDDDNQDDDTEKNGLYPYLNRLEWLLHWFPDSCRVYDHAGRLPIHVAVAASLPLEGLQVLVRAWPDSLLQCDGVHMLPPVFLGGASYAMSSSLDEIFFLLVSAPETLFSARHCAAGCSHSSGKKS